MMAPKSKQPAAPTPPPPSTTTPEPRTIGEKLQAEYLASRPLQVAFEKKGWNGLSSTEQAAYTNFRFLETRAYLTWAPAQQKESLKLCEQQKIPLSLPKPSLLGKDSRGTPLEEYTLEEYRAWKLAKEKLELRKLESRLFRERLRTERSNQRLRQNKGVDIKGVKGEKSFVGSGPPVTNEEIQEERQRRRMIAQEERGKNPGKYEGDPEWDDVIPIPQDDGENPLAAIAYNDEYAEAMSYLRAVMAAGEHSQRVLSLTEHIISMNPAHYTVWRYRATTLFTLKSDLGAELEWVNEVALENQKNYQIWHHRQLVLDELYPAIENDATKRREFARSEVDFMTQMFDLDPKNYHVWSYRQYLVKKLGLFPSQCSDPSEMESVENLLRQDVRNNSAWSHRFFLVFSDPAHSTGGIKATERDEKIPNSIIDREVEFTKGSIWQAPQNMSPWNYLRGVLKKGGRSLASVENFASEFVKLCEGEDEDIKSSHALDLLADVWAEKGSKPNAEKALRLLGDKYDPIRKNYWDWRRNVLFGDAS